MMSQSQKQILAVGGIQLNVFSPLHDPGKTTNGVAVLFLLHGRLSKADGLEAIAMKLVEKSEDKRRSTSDGAALSLVVITFVRGTVRPGERLLTLPSAQDLRNHGIRMINPQGNQQWSRKAKEDNPRHAYVPQRPSSRLIGDVDGDLGSTCLA